MEISISVTSHTKAVGPDEQDAYNSIAGATVDVGEELTPAQLASIGATLVQGLGLIVRDSLKQPSRDLIAAKVLDYLERQEDKPDDNGRARAEETAKRLRQHIPGLQVEIVDLSDPKATSRMAAELTKHTEKNTPDHLGEAEAEADQKAGERAGVH